VSEQKGAPAAAPDLERRRPALPLWLWMLLLTVGIAALLYVVGRQSFAP
jgi:hypothetical protein